MMALRDGRQQWSLTKLLTIAAFLLLTFSSCSGKEGAWPRISKSGILRVGLDPTYPPFEDADSGELRGIDVELARSIGDSLGLNVEFVYFGYDGLYDALLTEKVDVLISALVVMAEKTKDFSYSAPYFNAGQVLIYQQNRPDGPQLESEAGTLAVELGAEGHVEATVIQRRNPRLVIVPYDTGQEVLKAVNDGDANVAIIDHVSARLFLRDLEGELRLLDPPLTDEPYAAVVRSEDELLLSKLNDALNELARSGRLQQIIAKWLD